MIAGERAGELGAAQAGERAERGAGVHPSQRALSLRLADRLAAAGRTGCEPSQIGGHAGDAVGVMATEVRVDQHVGDALGVARGHAGPLEAPPHQ